MEKQTIIEKLSTDRVSVVTQKVITDEGVTYPIGMPNREMYSNSLKGRERLQHDVAEPYLSSVLALWGETPTLTDDIPETLLNKK